MPGAGRWHHWHLRKRLPAANEWSVKPGERRCILLAANRCSPRYNAPMVYSFLAAIVLVLHGLFLLFVVFGAISVYWWPKMVWLHVPCFAWGAMIEFRGWVCPLTYVENALHRAAGAEGYSDGFIAHYLMPMIYPPGLTPSMQLLLGIGVLVINAIAYAVIWWLR